MKNKKLLFLICVCAFFITDMVAEAYNVNVYTRRGRNPAWTMDVNTDKAAYSPGEQIRLRSVVTYKGPNFSGSGAVISEISAKINGVSQTVLTNYSVQGDSYDLRYVAENTPGTYFVEIIPGNTTITTVPSPARFSYTVANTDNGCAANTCVGSTCFNGTTTVSGTQDCAICGSALATCNNGSASYKGYGSIWYCDTDTDSMKCQMSPVKGSCGSSNGVASFTAPTSNFCSSGTYSGTSGSGPWTWSCLGQYGGSAASCSAPLAAGNCGASNGQYLYSTPTSGLCSSGTASSVSGSGPWSWTCNGTACSANKKYDCNNKCSNIYSYTQATFQSSDATCTNPIASPTYSLNCSCGAKASDPFAYTSICAPPVNGACGTDNGRSFTAPSSPTNLCSTGSQSALVSSASGWTWSCLGANGGINSSCSATLNIPVNGVCGSDNGRSFTSPASPSNLCSAGDQSPLVTNAAGWIWSCLGKFGGSNSSCFATLNVPVDGVCGSDNQRKIGFTPTNLCSLGTPTTVSGTGPWNWSCGGVYGGSSTNCSAEMAETVNSSNWREVKP